MLLLSPTSVSFAGRPWDNVAAIAVDRSAERHDIEWTDLGPHAAHADVPEQRVLIKVRSLLLRDDLRAPAPGELGALVFHASAGGAGGAGVRITVSSAVVMSVRHEVAGVEPGGRAPRATREITLIALSSDGATDPIAIADAG